MKRAKHPPSPELVAECSVFADMIALGRRRDITFSDELGFTPSQIWESKMAWIRHHPAQGALELNADAICRILTEIAMSEYLRRFPKTRKMNSDPWHEESLLKEPGSRSYSHDAYTGERDYQCFFCRKSLNTIPRHRSIGSNTPLIRKIRDHNEECGIRLLAGLMTPHKPLKRGEPGL
jgi:hypothetical protein